MTAAVATRRTGIAGVPQVSRIGKGDLRELFSDWQVVQKVSSILGFPSDTKIGRPFGCILPGHDPGHLSATLWRNRRGVIVYHDRHPHADLTVCTLPEVYFARSTGEIRKLRGPTGAIWALRLLAEAHIVQPVHIDLPELPSSAPPDVHKVYAGFKELLSLKCAYETGAQPTPFSHRFAAAWCGVSENTAGEGIRDLLRRDVIRVAGYVPGPFGKKMALFVPGPGHNKGDQPPAPIVAPQLLLGGSLDDN